MKKLAFSIIALVSLITTGCRQSLENDYVVIEAISTTTELDNSDRKYKVSFKDFYSDELVYYTDSLYNVEDTLWLLKH